MSPRFAWWRSGTDVEREVREELESHVELRVEDNLASGMPLERARQEAMRRFGSMSNVARASTEIRQGNRSIARAVAVDLRQAALAIRRSPRVTALGVIVTAIGLATALAATLIGDALLVRVPPGVRQGRQLWSVLDTFDGSKPVMMSYASLQAIERAAPELRPFAWSSRSLQVVAGSVSLIHPGELVTGNYFAALGVSPLAGRFLDAEDIANKRDVVVLSAELARRLGGSVNAIVGRSVVVNGRRFEIAGIASRGFHGTDSSRPAGIWLPIWVEPEISVPQLRPDGVRVRGRLSEPGTGWLRAGIRKPDDVTAEAISARLGTAVTTNPEDKYRDRKRGVALHDRLWLSPFSAERERLQVVMTPIAATVVLTLVLTSACLASLFIGRVTDRQRELGVRTALGASRGRIARLVMLENVSIVAAGTAIAVFGARLLLSAAGALQLAPGVLVSTASVSFDARSSAVVAIFAAAVMIASSLPCLLVAFRLSGTLRIESTRATPAGTKWRRVLMAAQVAVACGLIAGALLLTRTIDALVQRPIGFDADRVAYAEFSPPASGLSEAETARFTETMLAKARAAGIQAAAADEPPFGGQFTLILRGEGGVHERFLATPASRIAGPYFETLGTQLIAGRTFELADANRKVAVVSEPFAKSWWPGVNPLGRHIRIGSETGAEYEIVGVVSGFRDLSFRAEPIARVYVPVERASGTVAIIGRGADQAARVAEDLVALARGIDPRLVPLRSGTVDQLARRTIEQRLLVRLLTAIVGAGSLVMIAAGVWGLAYGNLQRRRREFGVRQALGARPLEIARLAVADARFVAIAGCTVGILAAWQFGQILGTWLFNVAPYDPVALGLSAVVVAAAAFAGAAWPARQAVSLDASRLLRED